MCVENNCFEYVLNIDSFFVQIYNMKRFYIHKA